ncbi:MAG: DUF2197 domain-containing protein [Bacillota bacterium]
MEVKCSFCGKIQELPKTHKDYQRLANNPQGTFVCFICNNKLKLQAYEMIKGEKKPI